MISRCDLIEKTKLIIFQQDNKQFPFVYDSELNFFFVKQAARWLGRNWSSNLSRLKLNTHLRYFFASNETTNE